MGAKCCSSEAAASARKDWATEACADEAIQVEMDDSLKAEGRPLWVLQLEEAEAEAELSASMQPSSEEVERPVSPPPEKPQVPAEEREVPKGKARAKSRPRKPAEAAPPWRASASAAPAAQEEVVAQVSDPKPTARRVTGIRPPGMDSIYHVLRITVSGAKNLRNADGPLGASDPYVVCEIPGKPSSKFKTAVIDDSLNPLWNHKVEMVGFETGDSLRFRVYDQDMLTADDSMGVCTLGHQAFIPGGFSGELPLREKLDKSSREVGRLDVQISHLSSFCKMGKVKPQIKEVEEDYEADDLREVSVTFYSARNLRNADLAPGTGVSDPYCICEVPNKPKVSVRTPTVHDNLHPVWNFTGKLHGYRMGDPLVFTVMDKDIIKVDDLLGRATISGETMLSGGFYGDLKLSTKGSIKVKVAIGEPRKRGEVQEAGEDTAEELERRKAAEAEEKEKRSQALLEAAGKGDAKTVKKLLASGAAIDAANAAGFTILHLCVTRRQEDLLAHILQQKGKKRLMSMRTKDATKDTALHLAARDDQKAVCALLVREGANVRIKNGAHKFPYQVARGELAKWLQEEDPAGTPPPW